MLEREENLRKKWVDLKEAADKTLKALEPIQNEYATLMTDVRDMIEYTYQPKFEPPQAVMPVANTESKEEGEGNESDKSPEDDKPAEEDKSPNAEEAPEPEKEEG